MLPDKKGSGITAKDAENIQKFLQSAK